MKEIKITGEYIELDQLLKLAGVVSTGGHAKRVIQAGLVTVNGAVCTMRGKKLRDGDEVVFEGQSVTVRV